MTASRVGGVLGKDKGAQGRLLGNMSPFKD